MIPEESIIAKPEDGGIHQNQPDQQPVYLPTYDGVEPPPPYDPIPPPAYPSDIGGDLTGPFASKKVQMKFTRKVYAIQAVQLLVTTAVVGLFTYYDEMRPW